MIQVESLNHEGLAQGNPKTHKAAQLILVKKHVPNSQLPHELPRLGNLIFRPKKSPKPDGI